MKQHTPLKNASSGLLGALAIASGTSAYASVINVLPPADFGTTPGGPNTTMNWDVNSDGLNDFIFSARFPNTSGATNGVVWQLNMNGAVTTSGTLGYAGPFIRYAFALAGGAAIGPAGNFNAGGQTCLGSKYNYGGSAYYYGGFAAAGPNASVAPGTFAFAGFKFSAADGVHFGWIKLAVNNGMIDFANPVAAAYESTVNTAITAGTTGAAVPEPGTIALLALGAVGVLGAAIKRRVA